MSEEVTAIVQMTNAGGSDQRSGSGDGEKWSYSGCILKRKDGWNCDQLRCGRL